MSLGLRALAVGTFAPMLTSLGEWLAKGAAHARENKVDLVGARLAPDMYTLAQQVQLACHHATDAVTRLSGAAPGVMEEVETTFTGLEAQIARTQARLRAVTEEAFAGASDRDCSVPLPNDMAIVMNGTRFLTAWALPHFYFHVVTAYDVLRHHGVPLGKKDYLSQVGAFIAPRQK